MSADPHKATRDRVRRLAAKHRIEVDRFHTCVAVWPPVGYCDKHGDPWSFDHFIYPLDWTEVLRRVEHYAGVDGFGPKPKDEPVIKLKDD